MKYYENVLETIGKTPLIKLSKISEGFKYKSFCKS